MDGVVSAEAAAEEDGKGLLYYLLNALIRHAGGVTVPQFGIVALRALCLIAAMSACFAYKARRTPPPPRSGEGFFLR